MCHESPTASILTTLITSIGLTFIGWHIKAFDNGRCLLYTRRNAFRWSEWSLLAYRQDDLEPDQMTAILVSSGQRHQESYSPMTLVDVAHLPGRFLYVERRPCLCQVQGVLRCHTDNSYHSRHHPCPIPVGMCSLQLPILCLAKAMRSTLMPILVVDEQTGPRQSHLSPSIHLMGFPPHRPRRRDAVLGLPDRLDPIEGQ